MIDHNNELLIMRAQGLIYKHYLLSAMCSARTSLTTGDLLRASLAEATEYCPVDSSRATGTTCSIRAHAVQGGGVHTQCAGGGGGGCWYNKHNVIHNHLQC